MKKNFSIVLPTFNEQENIAKTVKTLEEKYPEAEIILVDDSPDDMTINAVKKASKNAKIIKNKEPIGLSGSILEGIKRALHQKAIVLDADLQHPIEKIGEIAKELDEYDLVIAERKGELNSKIERSLFSLLAINIANFSLLIRGKRRYTDPLTGFFGINKNFLKKINEKKIVKKGWKISFDLLKQTESKNVGEIFFDELNNRKKGKSKFGIKPIAYFLLSLIS